MSIDAFFERIRTRHLESVARGEHDGQCEYDPRGFYICHCAKRLREATGFTEPPTEELYFPPPSCPRCSADLGWDDGWGCAACHLQWDESGANASFTDDHGDTLAEDARKWKAARDAKAVTA